MKVQIEGNVYLESDSMQFIIKEYTGNTDKNGNELSKTLGYFPKISSALKHVVKLKLMQSTAETLYELLYDLRRIEKFFEEKFAYLETFDERPEGSESTEKLNEVAAEQGQGDTQDGE